MNKREYWLRVMTQAVKYTSSSTGVSWTVWLYVLGSFGLGLAFFYLFNENVTAALIQDKVGEFLVFSIAGGLAMWIGFLAIGVPKAIFEIHQEQETRLSAHASRLDDKSNKAQVLSELAILCEDGSKIRDMDVRNDREYFNFLATNHMWAKKTRRAIAQNLSEAEAALWDSAPLDPAMQFKRGYSAGHDEDLLRLNSVLLSLHAICEKVSCGVTVPPQPTK